MKESIRRKLLFLDSIFISGLHRWSIPCLRISLGIVFIWFGLLKVTGHSPVEYLIESTFSFLHFPGFYIVLGAVETIIGLGLVTKIQLRITLILLWLQLLGTFTSVAMHPPLFFQGNNPLLLTVEGEFVVKNLVLFSSGLVIGGFRLVPSYFQTEK